MTFEKVKEIIVETVNCNEDAVTPEVNLREGLNIDSLDVVELNMALEEAFDLSISDEDLLTFICVNDIVAYIDSHIA